MEELTIRDGKATRKAKKIICGECGKEWLIRKDRKHSGFCRACKVKGKRNPMSGKKSWNHINGNRARECNLEYLAKVRRDRKKQILLMMGNKCAHCGAENLPMCCYHMHHVDPETKVFSIMSKLNENRLFANDMEIMRQEMEKCDLICKNCHCIEHYGDERAE